MKKLLLLLLAALPLFVFAQKQPQGVTYEAQILKVTDGDTVRVYGVDTPEKGHRAQCPSEAQRGEMATKFTTQLVARSTQRFVVIYGWDKFGGRVLGDLILDGQSLRAQLIANGFAREYYGEAKQSWCN